MTAFLVASACGGGHSRPTSPPPTPESTAEPELDAPAQESADLQAAAAAKSIASLMNQNRSALHRCWERAAADDFRLSGELRLLVSIAAGGKVSDVALKSDALLDGVLTSCVTDLVLGWSVLGFPDDTSLELPFLFPAVDAQYTVRAEDVPTRVLKIGITAKVLLHAASVDATQASMSMVTVVPGQAVRWHKHTASVEVIFVLAGAGRLSPKGPLITAGGAGYVHSGQAHGFWNTEKMPATLLVLYAQPGPERRFLGMLDPTTAPAKPGRKRIRATHSKDAKEFSIASGRGHGRGRVRILFDKKSAKDGAASLGVATLDTGLVIPEHVHQQSAELLYIIAGTGVLTIDGDEIPVFPGTAIHIPANTKHAFRVTSQESVQAVQVYAPGGPEQRFKKAVR